MLLSTQENKQFYHLYKLASWGWYHITSFEFSSMEEAKQYYKKELYCKDFDSNNVGCHLVTRDEKGPENLIKDQKDE